LKPGPVQEADITALSHDGRGIARIDGKVTFVPGALPGERVTLRIVKRGRQMDEAWLGDILIASPDRVAAKCAHFGVCGGCALQHLAPAAQLAAKQAQLLADLEHIGRVRPQRVLAPTPGPAWAYRRRARIGVRYVRKKGRVLAGFRERDKPYVADVQHCEVLVGELRSLPQDLAALVETLDIREHVAQVEIAVGDAAAALVVRVMRTPSEQDLERLRSFGRDRGVILYLQPGGLDSITPLDLESAALYYTIESDERARDESARIVIEFGPADFIQVNRRINAAMIEAAVLHLAAEPGDVVLDLFCGLGNFTLPLSRRALRVLGVEGDAGLVAKAHANAARNAIGNVNFITENLFEPEKFGAWAAQQYDRVLLDPPRAGARELALRMAAWRPRRVVYISCHPGSLARDAGILVETQGFRLIAAGVMDMFPHTTHVESIAVFEAGA
jgi:23S rRNA (uracil1939-C5)-methyltransferase